jgi:hypothetical protein
MSLVGSEYPALPSVISTGQGATGGQSWKSGEVAVDRNEVIDAMFKANRGDASVVHFRSAYVCHPCEVHEPGEMF